MKSQLPDPSFLGMTQFYLCDGFINLNSIIFLSSPNPCSPGRITS